MSQAKPLREAVKARFYPFAAARGFVRDKSKDPNFVIFRRTVDETVQVFDIQWDKYWRPRFVLNFSEGPVNGLEVQGVRVEGNELEPYHCEIGGRLLPKPRRDGAEGNWFQLNRPWLEVLTTMKRKYEIDEVVDQLIACFPEIEAWWRDKFKGPHLHFIR